MTVFWKHFSATLGTFCAFMVFMMMWTLLDMSVSSEHKFLAYCTTHSPVAECRVYWDDGVWP